MRKPHIPPIILVLGAVAGMLVAGTAVAAVLTLSSSGQITSHDSIELTVNGSETLAQVFPALHPGTQVTVTDNAGKVLAAPLLTQGAESVGTVLNAEFLDFTVSVPAGLPEYGISIPGQGTFWVTPGQLAAGVTVTLEG